MPPHASCDYKQGFGEVIGLWEFMAKYAVMGWGLMGNEVGREYCEGKVDLPPWFPSLTSDS